MLLKRTVYFFRERPGKTQKFRFSTVIDVEVPEAQKSQVKPVYRIGQETIYFADTQYWILAKGVTVKKLTDGFRDGMMPYRPADTLDMGIKAAKKDALSYLVVDYETVYRKVEKPAYAVIMRAGMPTIEAVYMQQAAAKLPKFCKLFDPEMKATVIANARQVARLISTVSEEEIQISRAQEIHIISEEEAGKRESSSSIPKLAPGFVLNDMDNPSVLAAFIAGHEQVTAYCGINDQGERVRLSVSAAHGMEVHTNQSNGWIRVTHFDTAGLLTSESYGGKWNKEE